MSEGTQEPGQTQAGENAATIDFHYLKSNHFRVIHADGVWGGPTAQQNISMTFFSERRAIPTLTQQTLGPAGPIGQEKIVKQRDGVVRELEACVIMDFNTAIEFHRWFRTKIESARKIVGISDADWAKVVKERFDVES